MKKCKKNIVIIFVLLLVLNNVAYCFTIDDYSIDIPSEFSIKLDDNNYGKENGTNILIMYFDDENLPIGNPFTEENLQKIEESTQESGKKELENYVEQYDITNSSYKIILKEITTISKNNYKCFHFVTEAQINDYKTYVSQYCVIVLNGYYMINITSLTQEELQDETVSKMLDSFTIDNYKENNIINNIVYKGAVGGAEAVISTFVVLIISSIAIKFKKNKNISKDKEKNEEVKEKIIKDDIEENKIAISEKEIGEIEETEIENKEELNVSVQSYAEKFCSNCGKKIEDNWKYCNGCGNKIERKCTKCNNVIESEWTFCKYCGNRLKK